MEFGTKVSKRLSTKVENVAEEEVDTELLACYPTALQMYRLPPMCDVSLEEFNSFAIERLQALRIVENAGFKEQKHSKEYREVLQNEFRKQNLPFLKCTSRDGNERNKELQDRRKDHISHFILRLAFCKTEDLRRWFLQQEVDLFRFRYKGESAMVITEFLANNNLNYTLVTNEEKSQLNTKLVNASHELIETENSVQDKDYFKVHFLEALDLVRDRKVFVKNGFAYVPSNELSSIIVSLFRQDLSRDLAKMCRALPMLDGDRRLSSILNDLHVTYTGNDYASGETLNGSEFTRSMIDELSRKHFPLCMRNLHNQLRKDHHLKHGGRQQYGLFLKGLGLSLEEALQFWREELSKIIGVEKFEKQYAYNIRHNYGKEGKRANYTPYSCIKIIMSNPPGPGDNHGCFFRHNDIPTVMQKLQQYRLPYNVTNEIKDLVTKGHCQVACTRFLEASVGRSVSQAISHPNEYFEESRRDVEAVTSTTASTSKLSRTTEKKVTGLEFDDGNLTDEMMLEVEAKASMSILYEKMPAEK